MPKALLTSMGAIRAYIYGCRRAATFTMVSVRTGVRYTYRLRRKQHSESFFFIDLLTGDDNENGFSFIGTVRRDSDGWGFKHSSSSPIGLNAASIAAITGFINRTNYGKKIDPEKFQFWHSGTCSRCGRALTVPESLAAGILANV